MNNKAVIGKTFTLFIATIAIVIILLIFVISSSTIKEIDNSNAGLKIYTSADLDLDNIQEYMIKYLGLTKIRFFINKGFSLENAIKEANYEK
ncbi:MAG: hypothetical protein WC494_02955 [Candidatus Pacearchaeota archaeon]